MPALSDEKKTWLVQLALGALHSDTQQERDANVAEFERCAAAGRVWLPRHQCWSPCSYFYKANGRTTKDLDAAIASWAEEN